MLHDLVSVSRIDLFIEEGYGICGIPLPQGYAFAPSVPEGSVSIGEGIMWGFPVHVWADKAASLLRLYFYTSEPQLWSHGYGGIAASGRAVEISFSATFEVVQLSP